VKQLEGVAEKDECLILKIPVEATVGLKSNAVTNVQAALVAYVKDKWRGVDAVPFGKAGRFSSEMIAGVPFPVTLRRYSDVQALGGRFYFQRLLSGDLEAARGARFVTVCEWKFPKLEVWKRDEGARTVLVLEDIDIAVTNEQAMWEALQKAEEKFAERPDEVYAVNACLPDPWYVTCLRRLGKTYCYDGERYFEIASGSLRDLTGR
jgi:hypothetical protein